MINTLTTLLIFLALGVNAQEPQLVGGLTSFIKKNTIYPAYSLQNCIQGTVNIGFKLNAKGEVYAANVVRGIGTDLDDEAIRLINLSSGKWILPANHDTLSLILIPIGFSLQGYGCESRDKNAIATAIRAYKAETALIDIIQAFYKSKEAGNYNPEEEQKINKLKSDLDIDDAYLEERIEVGLKKIKQGDKRGACMEFNFVKYMGSDKASALLAKYCN
jgi:TonB family protein